MPKLRLPQKPLRSKTNLKWLGGLLLVILLLVALKYFVIDRADRKMEQVIKIGNGAASQQVDGDYADAAQTYIKAYETAPDAASQANAANNTADAYESAIQYSQALAWYTKAATQYKAAGDTDSASEAEQSIVRVKGYMSNADAANAQQPEEAATE